MLKTIRRNAYPRLAALVHHHIALRVITRTITLFDKYHLVISYEWMRCGLRLGNPTIHGRITEVTGELELEANYSLLRRLLT